MKKPLVSVITVVYNGEASLEDTIRSVAGQHFKNLEYIIIDGGSKDATLNIIKRYPDTVTRWISEKDKGVYDAMNKGIRLAEGEWLYFLGSDDLFQDPDVLARFFSDPGTGNFDLIYGDVLSPSYKGRYDGLFTYEKLLSRNLSHQAAFYKKSLFTRLGDYNQHYRMHADWDFNLRCFGDATVRTHYSSVVVATFGAEGISAGHDLFFLRERLIPAKLLWLEKTGYQALRRPRLYDEWWRFLRNAGFRDHASTEITNPNEPGTGRPGNSLPAFFPAPLRRMLCWQRVLPEKLLMNGVISKNWMFVSYLINRLTLSI
jgi:glycosyltransferase involved in cell wall biosynthesis